MGRQVRWVIDSNCLQSDDLASFLSASRDHVAVITDYTCMETFKARHDLAVNDRLSILARFPRQMLMLRSTRVVCTLRGREAGLSRRLIDLDQTNNFQEFCEQVARFAAGDDRFRTDLLRKQLLARTHLAKMESDLADRARDYEELEALFTPAEIRSIRGRAIGASAGQKFFDLVEGLAESMFKDHPYTKRQPSLREWPNTFIYRLALFQMVHFLDWIRGGSPSNLSAEKSRNDAVDQLLGVYATYFDGLFTDDKKSLRIYAEASLLLEKFILPATRAANP